MFVDVFFFSTVLQLVPCLCQGAANKLISSGFLVQIQPNSIQTWDGIFLSPFFPLCCIWYFCTVPLGASGVLPRYPVVATFDRMDYSHPCRAQPLSERTSSLKILLQYFVVVISYSQFTHCTSVVLFCTAQMHFMYSQQLLFGTSRVYI